MAPPFKSLVSFFSAGIISDLSLTTSNVRGFSRWKSSSKYTVGIVDSGGGPCAPLRIPAELVLRRGLGGSTELIEDMEDVDPFLVTFGLELGCKWPSELSLASSYLLPRRLTGVAGSSSVSCKLCSCWYNALTWDRYGANSLASTWGMFVSVTGGISLAVGGFWALKADTAVCGCKPVRTIGACKRVEIATACQHSLTLKTAFIATHHSGQLPELSPTDLLCR